MRAASLLIRLYLGVSTEIAPKMDAIYKAVTHCKSVSTLLSWELFNDTKGSGVVATRLVVPKVRLVLSSTHNNVWRI